MNRNITLLTIANTVKHRMITDGLELNQNNILDELYHVYDDNYQIVKDEDLTSNEIYIIEQYIMRKAKYYYKIVSSFDPTDILCNSADDTNNIGYNSYYEADNDGQNEMLIRKLDSDQYYVSVYEK